MPGGIGDDIKDVLQELGTPISILKLDGSIISGEYIDYEHYYEKVTEFRRQFCYSGDFQFDSAVKQGDVISFDDKSFLMMNVKRDLFEGEAVITSNYFIECNVTDGVFKRNMETRDPVTRRLSSGWTNLHENCNAVMVEKEVRIHPEQVMNFSLHHFTLYTMAYPDIVVGDRWFPDAANTSEYYKVMSISKFKFAGLLTIDLQEDARD